MSKRGRLIVAESFADVQVERTRWLWQGRIPLGAPTLLVGREKLGKSTLTVALAAAVSRGSLPGDLEGEPSSVLILSYEDAASSTVKPRLLAANADTARVYHLLAKREGVRDLVSLPGDVERVGELVREHTCRLIIVDPFSASLGGEIDSHRDQDVRRAIAALAQLAESQTAALLLVAHFSKAQSGDSLTRVLGSRGLTAACRSVLVFGRAPDNPDASRDRVLAHAACNVGPEAPSLACRIEGHTVDGDNEEIETSRLVIVGDCDTHADDLLATRSGDERSDRDIATEWLLDELADGAWQQARAVKARAKEADISERTLQRARSHLGIEYRRAGFQAGSEWRLAVVPPPKALAGTTTLGTTEQIRAAEPNTPTTVDQACQVEHNGTTGSSPGGSAPALRSPCAYPTHLDRWRAHPNTGLVICWKCHPPAGGSE